MKPPEMMGTVTRTSILPISAQTAASLARKPATMSYALSPILRTYRLNVDDPIEVGSRGSARLWWFGIVPSWTHHITVEKLDALEICTREHGGPVHTWNHRLTFESVDEHSCRYTDAIETDPGWRGAPTRLFVRLMFRHRHRRWRVLAEILRD